MSGFLRTMPNTAEGPSAFSNRGLFTTIARSRGDVLCRLDGVVIVHGNDFDLLDKTEWNALDDDRILLRRTPTSYYLINHSPAPNLTIDTRTHELRSAHDIPKDTELLLDYLENGFPQAYLTSDRCAYLR
jgi:hypothetical protein